MLSILAGLAVWVVPSIAARFGIGEWTRTDFERHSIPLDEIHSGGPPKDGIPAIDSPKFVTIAGAKRWLCAQEPVIAVTSDLEAKAYPLQILIWHEIVNDAIGTTPISVTFCPLCNSSIVYERRIGERVLDFGTTGRLRKSDMVMYDRQTESWWQQLTGEAIVGVLTGKKLRTLPSGIVSFEQFARAFPNGRVLSRETGYSRRYGVNPYTGYDSITDRPFLFYGTVDPRLPPMERVLNVDVEGRKKIYPFRAFSSTPVINDEVGGVPLVIFSAPGASSALDTQYVAEGRKVPSATAYVRRLDGKKLEFRAGEGGFVDDATGSKWNLFGRASSGPLAGRRLQPATSGIHFAFAWLAFNPDAPIYHAGEKTKRDRK